MKHTINQWQLALIVFSFIMGSSMLMAPNLTAFSASQDAWISMTLAVGVGVLLNVLWLFLMKKYEFQSIFRITELAAGKVMGTILNAIIVFYAIHLAAYVVRNLSNFMISNVIPESSPWTFQIMMILLAIYSCYYGFNNIGRVSEFFNPWMMLLFAGSLLLVINKFQFSNLKPVLDQKFIKIAEGAYMTIGFPFIEVLLLGSVFVFVKQKEKIIKSYMSGLLWGGAVLIIVVFLAVGIEGQYMVKRQSFPTFDLMRDISVIVIFERIEVLIAVVWIFGILVKVIVCLFAAVSGLQQISGHSNYRAFLLPCGIIIWAMGNHEHDNLMEFIDFVGQNWTLWWFTLYVILVLVMVVGLIRKKNNSTGSMMT
ncbi:endospore germination permease [Fictibacillus iocasae]|uniref:Endospore germination permease n=1 Tax=Fictibacillus iocasae TaxID=2715437 RepID=A0ABW2NM96_9BACL